MKKEYKKGVTSNKLDITVTGALLLTTIITGALASSVRVGAEDITDVTDTASVTVPASCSMTATVESEHSASIPNGIYSGSSDYFPNGIGKTKIATFCNDNNGYAIYAIGFTGDKYDGEDHTKLIGAASGQKITTGTATSGNDSKWAMKLIKETDDTKSYNPTALTIENGYDDYNVIPDTYTKVANYTSTTDQTLGSVLSTTYAAYISPTQVADTYTGKVKYTLVHPHTEAPAAPQTAATGKIQYFANVSDYQGTMADQNVAASVTLRPSNFSRTGYGFAGWSDKFDYATNPEAKFYGPNEIIRLNTADYTGTNPGLSLYAVWVKSQGSLQDSAKVASVCSGLTQAGPSVTPTLASVSALTDQRDNNTYAIAKLADGKCWMIENLRLADKDSSNNDIELSSTNTNNPSLPLTNIYDATNPTTSNHLSASTNPTSTAWCNNYNTACFDQSMLYTGNTTERGTTPATDANTYSYGNYYNWYSATAGNGKYANGYGYTAPGDICPSGWKLPLGNTSTGNIEQGESDAANRVGGFSYLDRKMGGTGQSQSTAADSLRWRKYPVNFLYSGYVYSGSVSFRGSDGFYWSSTADSIYNGGAYILNLGSSNVCPDIDSSSNDYGRTIRCLVGS